MDVKLHKIVIRMSKLTIRIMIVSQAIFTCLASETDAQSKLLSDIQITLEEDFSDAPLITLISSIEDKTDFKFAYSTKLINKKKVSIKEGSYTMYSLMQIVSGQVGISVKRVNESIVLAALKDQRQLPIIDDQVTLFEKISGQVLDETGQPLPGATIQVKGTVEGALTDLDGRFTLDVQSNSVLVISYVGFISQEVLVGTETEFLITLKLDVESLGEVVIVGYGVQKKINVTGSVETVESEELVRQPVFQTSQALAGLVPGLVATQSSGQPGADAATIRIRGIGTIGNGNDPLILVDGIQDNINGVDPSDIESISVLKDASASAIYGSRAANGVILITTKRGSSGQVKATYSNYFGFQAITEQLNVVDGLTYIETRNLVSPGYYDDATVAAYQANQGTDAFPDTDWVSEFFSESGFQQYHNVSISGGTENALVAASFSYQDQDGNAPNFNFERINGRINTDFKLSDKFSATADINFRRSFRTSPSAGITALTTTGIYRTQPIYDYMNDDGSWSSGWSGNNPIAAARDGGLRDDVDNYFRGLFNLSYSPISDLKISVTYSPQFTDRDIKTFFRQYEWFDNTDPGLRSRVSGQSGVRPASGARLQQVNQSSFQDNFNAVATYQKSFSDHNFGALLGYEFLSYRWNQFGAERVGFDVQEFEQLDNGDPENQFNSGRATAYSLVSYFGRLNYNYKEKYLFEANLRSDASSRFAEENRTAYFPSFSVGWRVSEETFFPENNILTSLKLRGSWGQLGNQDVGSNFPYTSSISLSASTPVIGGIPRLGGAQLVMANRDLKWETTETTNLAVDAQFFESRLSFTGEVYTRETDDILLGVTIQTSTGLEPAPQNAGSVKNTGWDLALGWRDNIGDFSYGANFNLSNYRNEVTFLNGLDELPPSNDQITRLGEAIGSIYGLKVLRFYTEEDFNADGTLVDDVPTSFSAVRPGDYLYEDINNDGVINDDDRQVLGSALPRMNWGLDLYAAFKGFDFSISFLGVGKREVPLKRFIGYPLINESAWSTLFEWHLDDYWTPENTEARFSRFEGGLNRTNNFRVNSRYVFDASYWRVRNITIGYTIPKAITDRVGITSFRVFVTGQNVFTSKDLPDGIDPLIPDNTQGVFYPVTAVYTTGLTINF